MQRSFVILKLLIALSVPQNLQFKLLVISCQNLVICFQISVDPLLSISLRNVVVYLELHLDFLFERLIELYFFPSVVDVFLVSLLFELLKLSIFVTQLFKLVVNNISMVHACLKLILLLLAEFFKNFEVSLNRIIHIYLFLKHLSLRNYRLLQFFKKPLIIITQFKSCILQIDRIRFENFAFFMIGFRKCVEL
jgi:hypothetical protein